MREVLDYDAYFFDLDGTLLLGEKLLPGAAEACSLLRREGKRLCFLTNTTLRTREECSRRLVRLGLNTKAEEVITAAYAAAVYLREQEPAPAVLVLGNAALRRELEEEGVRMTGLAEEATHVLAGMDMDFNYGLLTEAVRAVRRGARLVAANPDPNCPVEGDVLPDTWSIAKAIETASGVSIHAVAGKPSRYFGAKVLEWTGLPPSRCLMIGDRLETDIRFGLDFGLGTALVLTGSSDLHDLESFNGKPEYIWPTLAELVQLASGGVA